MTLYLDTSALVKLYILEAGSEDVLQWIADASSVCTSVVTFPEARSAFGRRLRERSRSPQERCARSMGYAASTPCSSSARCTPERWRRTTL